MKWAAFDADGFPMGFYAEDIHGPPMLPVFGIRPEPSEDVPDPVPPVTGYRRNPAVPVGVVEITQAQWLDMIEHPGLRRWNGTNVVSFEPPVSAEPQVPERVTNSDWRVGLILWGRFAEVEAKVAAARDSGEVSGLVAWQRWEYANHVERVELMSMREAFGFTVADVDESLRRGAAASA